MDCVCYNLSESQSHFVWSVSYGTNITVLCEVLERPSKQSSPFFQSIQVTVLILSILTINL
jgi:hypothetical protein